MAKKQIQLTNDGETVPGTRPTTETGGLISLPFFTDDDPTAPVNKDVWLLFIGGKLYLKAKIADAIYSVEMGLD